MSKSIHLWTPVLIALLAAAGCQPGELGGDDDDQPGADAGVPCAGPVCGDQCCDADQRCLEDAYCIPDLGPCATSDDCSFDSYCLDGQCVPYGVPPGHEYDDSCQTVIDIDDIVPAVQCRWTGPPDGDPNPLHVHVMSTPVVVDFDFDDDPGTLDPSIVFTSFPTQGSYGNPGVLRVIRGEDCTQQFSFSDPADATLAPSPVAVGDLDGDGRAEIVAPAHGGGMLAFRYQPGAGFSRLWRSATCTGGDRVPDNYGGGEWSGPSIHDLDDDGVPEVIYGGIVYAADGCIRSTALGFPTYSVGVVPVIADVDEDGAMELVFGNAIYEWRGGDWAAESYFAGGGLSAGQVAVADLGEFPLASFGGEDRAEVAVVSSGTLRVQTLEGTVVFGPFSIPGGGGGGPPTIADFDGDGQREMATAGGDRYVVFDFDCAAGGDPLGCNGEVRTDGVLWSQPSQDHSSSVTGSSVFDFDANGAAEAVYADECFLRIYEGATGNVLYSAARSSGTTYENPVIVDVDGDFRSEIVSAANDYAGTLGCPATDPLMASSSFATSHGIVVLRDELDRWASSRPIWSQHAYAVTHVGDHGEIPATSAVEVNWREPALNNFRQNVQGGLDALGIPDLTVGGGERVECTEETPQIWARVCNRGTLPVPAGTPVSFHADAVDGELLCATEVDEVLPVGGCVEVGCDADVRGRDVDLYVVIDGANQTDECYEGNNVAFYPGVGCPSAIP